ncbi:MAG: hypothetical protein RIF33_11080 [Cyclobacteriaceae bacterium]
MTIEHKKIALINWITTIEDEQVIDQIVGFQTASLDELPSAIVQMLQIAEDEPDQHLIKHTSAKDILEMK